MIRKRPRPPAVLLGALALGLAFVPASVLAQDRDDAPPPPRPPAPERSERIGPAPRPPMPGGRLGAMVEPGSEEDGVTGVRVRRVLPGSAAEEAGLEEGDVLLALDGESLSGPDGRQDPLDRLMALLAEHGAGEVIELTYLRNGERRSTGVELDEPRRDRIGITNRLERLSPEERTLIREEVRRAREMSREAGEEVREAVEEAREAVERARREMERVAEHHPDVRVLRRQAMSLPGVRWMGACGELFEGGILPGRCVAGLEVRELDPELGSYFGAESGVLVLDVAEGAGSELRPGDVIRAVGGRAVEDPSDLRRILRSYERDEEVELEILRESSSRTVPFRVP